MAKINRDYVLKTFLDKVREAKRQDMKEIKVPVNFLDDLAYIIMQLMSEELSKAYEAIENKPKEQVKPYLPIKKRVLKEFTPKKLKDMVKDVEVKPVDEEVKSTEPEVKPMVEELVKPYEEQPVVYKPKEQPKVEPVDEEPEEDDEDDNDNVLYGGTW